MRKIREVSEKLNIFNDFKPQYNKQDHEQHQNAVSMFWTTQLSEWFNDSTSSYISEWISVFEQSVCMCIYIYICIVDNIILM